MKSQSRNSNKKPLRLSASEMKDALKWVNRLSEKEIAMIEQLARIQVAQILFATYLRRRGKGDNRKTKKIK